LKGRGVRESRDVVLSCLVLSCLVWSCLVLSRLVLSCIYPVLSSLLTSPWMPRPISMVVSFKRSLRVAAPGMVTASETTTAQYTTALNDGVSISIHLNFTDTQRY
jgi:hypothetical protein